MRKFSLLTILLLCLLAWQGNVSAAQWMYFERLEGTRMGPCTEYVDAESVVKNGARLIYWTLWLLDEPGGDKQVRKVLWKNEATLSEPKQERALEFYQYNAEGEEVFQYLKPGVNSALLENSSALRAFQYLRKEGEAISPKPLNLAVSKPRWFTVGATHSGFKLLFDVRSIQPVVKTDPPNIPVLFEITVKRAWNAEGAETRRAFLMQQKYQQHGYEELSYTVTTYRFLTNSNKMMVLRTTDRDQNNIPLDCFVESDWREVAPGSVEEQIKRTGLRWFKGDLESM